MRKLFGFILLFLFVLTVQKGQAQTPTTTPPPAPTGIKANLAAGEVTAVSQTENKISLLTSDGAIDALITPSTVFKKIPPENPSIGAAVAATFSDIGEKDKVLITGVVSADKKTIPAKTVYLMSKSDIAKRDQAEKELWRTRGITGKVISVDFKTQNVTISTISLMGEAKNVILSPKEKVEYLRYAPDSAKYSDAVASSLAEIKVGDQLRALGDKSTDGATFKAEKFVTGSFKTVVGKITAIDLAKNEVTIEDATTKKPAVIVVTPTTSMKNFPPQQARMMAMMASGAAMQFGGGQGQGGQGQGGQGTTMVMRPPQGGQPNGQGGQPNNGQPTGGQTPQGGQGANGQPRVFTRNGSLEDMVNNLPNTTIAELKVGDTIGVSSPAGTVANHYTAIRLWAGVEPFLTTPRVNMGGGGGNQSPTINIPGLDGGFGNP